MTHRTTTPIRIPLLLLVLATCLGCRAAGPEASPPPVPSIQSMASIAPAPAGASLDEAMAAGRGEAGAAVARAAAQPFVPLQPSYSTRPASLAPYESQRGLLEWGLDTTSATVSLAVVDAHFEPPNLDDLRASVALLPSQTGVPLFTFSAALENFLIQRNAIRDATDTYLFGKLVIQVAARNVTREQWNKTISLFVYDDTGRLMKSESVTQYFRPNQTIYLRYEYPNTPRFARWVMRVGD